MVNDECENVILISSGIYDFIIVDVIIGDLGVYFVICFVGGGSIFDLFYNDVWFIYIVDFIGLAEFNNCGIVNYDVNVVIYVGIFCFFFFDDVIVCNEDGVILDGELCLDLGLIVIWEVEEGLVYII